MLYYVILTMIIRRRLLRETWQINTLVDFFVCILNQVIPLYGKAQNIFPRGVVVVRCDMNYDNKIPSTFDVQVQTWFLGHGDYYLKAWQNNMVVCFALLYPKPNITLCGMAQNILPRGVVICGMNFNNAIPSTNWHGHTIFHSWGLLPGPGESMTHQHGGCFFFIVS